MLADSMNRHFAELGSNQRIAITAIEGAAHHPADLVLLGEDGRVLAQIQSKLGWSKAIEALDDPKYAAMSIVTARDSLAIIEKELLKAEASAAGRGIQLPEQWQTVRKALASGRLMREPLPGLMLPTKAGALAGAERTALAEWNRLGATARGAEVADASIGLGTKISTKSLLLGTDEAEIAGAAIRLGGIVGGALIVLDVGATGFLAYQDFQRFNEAEIATGDYAFKGSLRATNLYLLYITVADPEPITKAGAAVALVVLIAVDVGHDWVIDSGNAAARQLLKSIDREERKQAVRGYLLDCVRQSGARPEPRLPEAAQ